MRPPQILDGADGKIKLQVGGCELIALIDSGAPINTIPSESWKSLRNNVKRSNVSDLSTEKVFAYASEAPLEIETTFTAETSVANFDKPQAPDTRWHVIKGAGQALLGKATAEKLKILKVGVEVKALSRQKDQRDNEQSIKPFPKIPNFQLKFKVDENVKPVRIPRVRIPAPLREAVQNRLDEMQSQGIIEDAPYDTEWINPLEVVIKGREDFRLVLDMRRPNEAIQRAHHPLPEVQQVLESIQGAVYFTKLDLTSAFFHIELHKDSRNITSFMTPKGLKRYTRMVFGVNTAPEVFQREMENIFRNCEGTIIFIDDILVFAETLLELRTRVAKVKDQIKQNSLTLNESKCKYDATQIDFLGMSISEKGFKPSPDKIEAIRDCQTPKNVESLRSFMGLVTHLSNYIKDLATVAEPLRRLIRKNTKWQWKDEEDKAFREVRKRICEDIDEQAFYNVNLQTKLYTDASGVGLGAILIQVQKNETNRIVAYASKSLTETEKKYPQAQRESLAVVWAIERFSHFLLGKHFTLYTDNKASEYLFGNKDRTSTRAITRAEGWALRLSMYSFNVKAVAGKENIADVLSRLCKPGDEAYKESTKNQEFFDVKFTIKSLRFESPREQDWDEKQLLHISLKETWNKQIIQEQNLNALYNSQETITWKTLSDESEKDETISQVKNALRTNNWSNTPSTFEKIKDQLYCKGEILIRGLQIVLPTNLRAKALEIVHLNHAGEASMKRTLRDRVWWPGLDKEVEQKRRDCKVCTQIAPKNPPPPMARTTLPDKPWESLAIDFFSAKECSAKVLSVTDYYSRYLVCLIVATETADKTIEALDKLFHRLGYPRTIKSDNGSPFQSKEFNDYCTAKNIELVHSIPYFPQQNGMSERSMQVIKKGIRIAVMENRNWKIALRNVEAAYNSTVHSVTLKTPNEMFFQRRVRGGLPLVERDEDFNDTGTRERDNSEKMKGKDREDKTRRARESGITVGDSVLIETLNPTSKLTPRFGPTTFTVTAAEGPKLYLENSDGTKTERHASQTKVWKKGGAAPETENATAGKVLEAEEVQETQVPAKQYETRSNVRKNSGTQENDQKPKRRGRPPKKQFIQKK